VDARAAKNAGHDSTLAGLRTVADSKRVAQVNYVSGDKQIEYATKTNTDASATATSSLNEKGLGGVTLFEKGPTPQSPENNLGFNSATPGVTEIYVNPLAPGNIMLPGSALTHETLEHFLPFTQTGNAAQSAHPNPDIKPPVKPPDENEGGS
jgi:hypothetical protein